MDNIIKLVFLIIILCMFVFCYHSISNNNKFNNIDTFNYGLSNDEFDGKMFVVPGNTSNGTIGNTEECADKDLISIKIKKATNVFTEKNIKNIKLLKIDVEGHEETIINELKIYFKEFPPSIILFELLWDDKLAFWNRGVTGILHDLGYKIYEINSQGNQVVIKSIPYHENSEKIFYPGGDFVAIHENYECPQHLIVD